MVRNLYLVNGTGYKSGKDTFGAMLATELREKSLEQAKASLIFKGMFAYQIKQFAARVTGIKMKNQYNAKTLHLNPFSAAVMDFSQEDKETFLLDWNMTLGRWLQLFATEGLRSVDEAFHVKAEAHRLNLLIKSHLASVPYAHSINIVITDWRFPNEEMLPQYLEGDWNVHKIHVHRDPIGQKQVKGSRVMTHASETQNLDAQITIYNNQDLEWLREAAAHYVQFDMKPV